MEQLGQEEREAWTELKLDLNGVQLDINSGDRVVWSLNKSGVFSVKSLYRFLSFGGVIHTRNQKIWKSKIPLKVKIFLWLAFQDRLQTTSQLKVRKWKGVDKCILCGVSETTDHILFTCVLANFVWTSIKEMLKWEKTPKSLDNFQHNWLDARGANYYNTCLFSFAALAWTLWKIRNKMAIEKNFPKQPIEALFKSISCLQKWRILVKEGEREDLDHVISLAEIWIHTTGSDSPSNAEM